MTEILKSTYEQLREAGEVFHLEDLPGLRINKANKNVKYVHYIDNNKNERIVLGNMDLGHWQLVGDNKEEILDKNFRNAGFITIRREDLLIHGFSGGLKDRNGDDFARIFEINPNLKSEWDNETQVFAKKLVGDKFDVKVLDRG